MAAQPRSQEVAQEAGARWPTTARETLRGVILHLRDDHAESAPLLRDAAEGLLAHGNRHIAATALAFQARVRRHREPVRPRWCTAQRAVELAEPLGDYHRVGTTRSMLARYTGPAPGDFEGAAAAPSRPCWRLIEDSAEEMFVPWLALAVGAPVPVARRSRSRLCRGSGVNGGLDRPVAARDVPRCSGPPGARRRVCASCAEDDEAASSRARGTQRRWPDAWGCRGPWRTRSSSRPFLSAATMTPTGRLSSTTPCAGGPSRSTGCARSTQTASTASAELAVITNRADRAARLIAASEQDRQTSGYPRPPDDRPAYLKLLADARDVLGEEPFAEQ